MSEKVKNNFVLKNCSVDLQSFSEAIDGIYDYRNRAYEELLPTQIGILLNSEELSQNITTEQSNNLLALRNFDKKNVILQSPIGNDLFENLSKNLSKNSRELRIHSLRVLQD